uniref:Reverse transcriptase zinc-binding domain-containing protein n=1 Tax=Setaria viridis TaxID=4556 RepID=A0A4U6VSM0_SETVI|nr:hypothetical protein SEVIR_2G133800v2 [Setaria viridis]
MAPDLCTLIRPAVTNARTVAQALSEKRWISDIAGPATVAALTQYVSLWHALDGLHLASGTEDKVSWRWNPSGNYTARSAYNAFFQGAIRFAAHKLIWKAWPPLRSSSLCDLLLKIVYGHQRGGAGIIEWWFDCRNDLDSLRKRGLDSAFMLVSWSIRKERNSRVFNREPPRLRGQLLTEIFEQVQLWYAAGANHLGPPSVARCRPAIFLNPPHFILPF